jgi:hypothetical protein
MEPLITPPKRTNLTSSLFSTMVERTKQLEGKDAELINIALILHIFRYLKKYENKRRLALGST